MLRRERRCWGTELLWVRDPSSSSVPPAMRAAPRGLERGCREGMRLGWRGQALEPAQPLPAGSLLPQSPPRAARQGFIARQHPSLTLQMPKRENEREFGPKGTNGGAAQPLRAPAGYRWRRRLGSPRIKPPFGNYIPSAPPQAQQGFNKTKPDGKKAPSHWGPRREAING